MNYNKKSIEDIDVAGKRVLCRCDFNVPTKNGVITSDKRIVAAMPTIKYLVDHNAKVILCSHYGKPKGEWKPELSLKIVADRISELLGKERHHGCRCGRRGRQGQGRRAEGRRRDAAGEHPV